jgi:type II secretory pathway pseudopilin PulG
MERVLRKLEKRSGFTIIELLTVMSIIIILMSLLLPGLNALRRYASEVKQRNQLRGIDGALEYYYAEWQTYPDSGRYDRSTPATPPGGIPYCGAMKLCEALVGQDMLGFHPKSRFYQTGTSNGVLYAGNLPVEFGGTDLYPGRRGDPYATPPVAPDPVNVLASRKERKSLYLTLESSNATRIGDIYSDAAILVGGYTSADAKTIPVLCDVYGINTNIVTGKPAGMPILYYKADPTKHSYYDYRYPESALNSIDNTDNIYNYWDNDDILQMGLPPQALAYHPMKSGLLAPEGPTIFYNKTLNESLSTPAPWRSDSYILLSAGYDGLYGTKDDIYDFMK